MGEGDVDAKVLSEGFGRGVRRNCGCLMRVLFLFRDQRRETYNVPDHMGVYQNFEMHSSVNSSGNIYKSAFLHKKIERSSFNFGPNSAKHNAVAWTPTLSPLVRRKLRTYRFMCHRNMPDIRIIR